MARGRARQHAVAGAAEHGHSVVLVTVTPGGALIDRRRVELTQGLPTHPHHHEGSWAVGRYLSTPGARAMPLAEAVALVDRVRAAALRGAEEALADLASSAAPMSIGTIAIRACPPLPPTTEARIADNRAQTVADTVMYRHALAEAAEARGWSVWWYDRARVAAEAAEALGLDDLDPLLRAMGQTAGPPWQAIHKLAAAAALAATGRAPRDGGARGAWR